ncbi:odorant receptor 13a-like isoform X2 [Rhodnius prolixus]|uniref:odorant receptor 13a-like isoform X2 n=1 Tax=Rhodnius prolixus TaxID=13249 RepID=UPI003D188969
MSNNIVKKVISLKKKEAESKKRNENEQAVISVNNAFKASYGYLLTWGGLFRGSMLYSTFYVLWTGMHIGFLVYTVCISKNDLGILFEAAHFVVLLTNACLGVVNHRYHKDKIEFILKCIGDNFFDYGHTIDDELSEEIEQIRKYRKEIKNFLATGSFLTVARPLYDIMVGTYFESDRSDGIVRTLPVAFWLPIQSEGIWVNIVAAFDEYYIIIGTAGIVLGVDISYLCFSHELCTELEILGLTLKKFDQRASFLYKFRYGTKLPKNMENDYHFNKCVEECLKESVKHHHLLLNYFNCHYTLNYIMLLALLLAATFMLCLSGFIFTSDGVLLSSKLTFLLFLASELCHTFIFCWYGEQIYQMNNNLGDELYRSKWTHYSKTVKNYILIMQARCNKPLRMSAGGFMEISLDTYSNVVSSAYSYFSLLRAIRE